VSLTPPSTASPAQYKHCLFSLERDVISCTSVCAGCGRPRVAPAKSQEQKTERRFTLTLLRLTHLSEQHLGRVTMQVNHFPGYRYCTIIMSGSFQKYPANTMEYMFHYSIAPPIANTLVHVPYRQYHFRPAPLWFSLSSLAQPTITPFMIGSRAVSVLNSGAEGPGFKLQPRRCRVTVLGKLLTPTVPLFTKQQNW